MLTRTYIELVINRHIIYAYSNFDVLRCPVEGVPIDVLLMGSMDECARNSSEISSSRVILAAMRCTDLARGSWARAADHTRRVRDGSSDVTPVRNGRRLVRNYWVVHADARPCVRAYARELRAQRQINSISRRCRNWPGDRPFNY